MPAERHWTVMVVPHGSGAPRSISLSARSARRLAYTAGGALLAVIFLSGAAVSRLGHAAPRLVGVLPLAAPGDSALESRLAALDDTLDAIAVRDERIRILAGLPPDSLSPTAPVALAAAGPADLDLLIQRANVLASSFAEVTDTLNRKAERYARIPSIMPTAGWLSSVFSKRRINPILGIARPHKGIDVAAPMGTPIVAPAAGTVVRAGMERGYGLALLIDHGNGMTTRYAHTSRLLVRAGDRVRRGQVIANVGNTGLSTGPHLHYEIEVNGRAVDPLTYVVPEGESPG